MSTIKITSVLAGPFHSSEVPDWDYEDEGFVLICNVWDADIGKLIQDEIVLETLDEAYEIMGHFMKQLRPYEMEVDDEEEELVN
jgi:hypothetical protein